MEPHKIIEFFLLIRDKIESTEVCWGSSSNLRSFLGHFLLHTPQTPFQTLANHIFLQTLLSRFNSLLSRFNSNLLDCHRTIAITIQVPLLKLFQFQLLAQLYHQQARRQRGDESERKREEWEMMSCKPIKYADKFSSADFYRCACAMKRKIEVLRLSGSNCLPPNASTAIATTVTTTITIIPQNFNCIQSVMVAFEQIKN